MIASLRQDAAHTPEGILDTSAPSPARRAFAARAEDGLDRTYRLAGLILGNATDAEDVVGEAIERAWREIDGLRDPARFEAWFDRIVANACRDHLRRRRSVRFIALEGGPPPLAPDVFAAVIDGDATTRAMVALTADERVVVILHFWADLTLEAVGERLGWPVGTVKSRLHRALVRMRAESPAGDRSGGVR
jgi:RNA polymerase sigma factor (sigma-70 family)